MYSVNIKVPRVTCNIILKRKPVNVILFFQNSKWNKAIDFYEKVPASISVIISWHVRDFLTFSKKHLPQKGCQSWQNWNLTD